MNILNAIHALGFAAKWVTGANCYDPEFKREFGLDPTDQLIGFIHVGTPSEKAPVERPDPAEFRRRVGRIDQRSNNVPKPGSLPLTPASRTPARRACGVAVTTGIWQRFSRGTIRSSVGR